MNRVSVLVLVLFSVAIVCSTPVLAQTDQGLEWGFASDDTFYFMMHLEGDGMNINKEIYLELNDTLPAIPDSMDNWTDIPWVSINAYYSNGTKLGIEVLTFIAMYNVHLPVGNWSFLSTLAEDTHNLENLTLDANDIFFWGYSWEDDNWVLSGEDWTIYSNYTIYVHVSYLKTDGFIAHYSVDSYNTTTMEQVGQITLSRLGIEKYSDNIAPAFNTLDDIVYTEGETGNSITWAPYDDYPASYQVLLDGDEIVSGAWNATGEVIVVNVDGHTAGEYNYTIVISDFRGNTATDEVEVRVHPSQGSPLTYIIVIAVAIVGVVIVIVGLKRR
ncbi:MAG: hypothetical protein ACFFDV_09330 [Candidatus Thorarchaeota archaeon]